MDIMSPSPAYCHEDQGPLLLGICWTLAGLAMLIVTLRIYFRLGLRHGLHSDDYTIAAAMIVGLIGAALLTKLVQAGAGKHIACLPPGQIYPVLKWSQLAQIANVLGIGLVKVSVCLCVLRLIDRARRRLSQFLWVLIAFVAVSHFVQILLFLLQCRPFNAMWNPKIKGTCFSAHVVYTAGYTNYGLDALTDIICAGIPICVIHRLQMNRRTKIALSLLMGLGVFTAACAIAKAIVLRTIFQEDYTRAITNPAILTMIEHYIGTILASMPALKPLFSKMLGTVSSHGSRRSFQQIKPVTASAFVAQSQTTSGRSSIRVTKIRKTTEWRVSSQLDLEVQRDYELSDAGALPKFLSRNGSSGMEGGNDPAMHTGGYTHIDEIQDTTSLTSPSSDVPMGQGYS